VEEAGITHGRIRREPSGQPAGVRLMAESGIAHPEEAPLVPPQHRPIPVMSTALRSPALTPEAEAATVRRVLRLPVAIGHLLQARRHARAVEARRHRASVAAEVAEAEAT